jgi:hypothetical protein
MENKNCKNCFYFNAWKDGGKRGVCHRWPYQKELTYSNGSYCYDANCTQDFWCGEFKPRKTKKE